MLNARSFTKHGFEVRYQKKQTIMEKNNDKTIIEDRQNYFLFPQKILKIYALKISRAKVAKPHVFYKAVVVAKK